MLYCVTSLKPSNVSRTMSLRYTSVADLLKATEVADDVKREKIHVICRILSDLRYKFDFAKKAGLDEVVYNIVYALKKWVNIVKLVKKRKGPKPKCIQNITIDQVLTYALIQLLVEYICALLY